MTVFRANLINEMVRSMTNNLDRSISRHEIVEAAVDVLVQRGIVTFPESLDRVSLMDEITGAMWDSDRAFKSDFSDYADIILNVFASHKLMGI